MLQKAKQTFWQLALKISTQETGLTIVLLAPTCQIISINVR